MRSDRGEPKSAAALRSLTEAVPAARPDRPVGLGLDDGELGRRGAILTRELSAPLAPGTTIKFAYFDPIRDSWRPVRTRISPDRRRLTAVIHHFSWWDTVTYGAGELLDERVDPPECSQELPRWTQPDGVAFLDDKNAPLRWCAGRDPRDTQRLEVKLRVNRSYGVAAKPTLAPVSVEASLSGGGPAEFLNGLVARRTQIPEVLRRGFGGQVPVMGGQEATFSFTEAQVRSLQGAPLIRVSLGVREAAASVVFWTLHKLGDQGHLGAAMRYVAALASIAQCESQVLRPASRGDWGEALDGLGGCLTSEAYTVSQLGARVLADAFPRESPRKLGAIAGRAARALKHMWVTGLAFKTATWAADRKLNSAAFEIRAFAKVKPPPVETQLPKLFTKETFAVRPTMVGFTGDGTGFVGKLPNGRGSGIRWSTWTAESAAGSGQIWINDCTPDCADGSFAPFEGTIYADRPRGGRFTHLAVQFRDGGRTVKHYRTLRHASGDPGYWDWFYADR
jgi:hypothetical protein